MNKKENKIDVKGPAGNLEAIVSEPTENQISLVFIKTQGNALG